MTKMANDSHYQNRTDSPNSEFCSSSECIAWLTILNIEAVAIVTMNALTIIIYLKERTLRKRSMYLVINLAVADMFVTYNVIVEILLLGNICNFWTITLYKRLGISEIVITSLVFFFPTASVTNLTAISLERMHATFRPFKHRLIKKKMFGAAVAGVWFTAALSTAIALSALRLDITIFFYVQVAHSLFLLGCLCIILVSYLSIAIKFYCGTHPQHHCATSKARKVTKTLFIVTIVSLILVLPYNIVRIGFYVELRSGERLETIFHQIKRNFNLMESFFCLFFANSFINPLLYALKMPEFKRALFL
ncbi:neuromedin-U receptor 2-like [Montipora foliosa]|uniref:neuromedin-U receptor 2-like n=1 Tax=Montipora foliosa TaxID=591990 RepID=UPI0035F10F55